MHDTNSDHLLACAVEAATTAATHARDHAGRRRETIEESRHDVKLRLDVECQEIAEGIIRSAFPDHAILGEEDKTLRAGEPMNKPVESDFEWIIDPIDGTVNFYHGIPFWCSSVAVRRNGEVLAGAVFAPVSGDLYTAAHDAPALCNKRPLHVSDVNTLDRAIVCTGMDKDPDPARPPLVVFSAIAMNTQKARILGSAALDLCMVAAGHADGYFETGVYLWDVAAAGLMVKQAGGAAEVIRAREGYQVSYLATNGHIHEPLKTLVGVGQIL